MSPSNGKRRLRRLGQVLLQGLTPDLLVCGGLVCGLGFLAWTASRAHGNIALLLCLTLWALMGTSILLGKRVLQRLTLQRTCPEFTFAGEALTVTLSLHNPGRIPLLGLQLAEALRPRRGAGGGRHVRAAPLFALAVDARSTLRARYQLLVRRRGVYRFGPTRVQSRFPFGLWNHSLLHQLPGQLLVYPRLGQISSELFEELERSQLLLQQYRACRAEYDFRGLREYRFGDHPKWIHWRSSARRGQLVVKEFEEPVTHRVLLLIDTCPRRVRREQRGRIPDFELAVSFAATAARAMLARGCELRALATGTPPWRVQVSRRSRNLAELLGGLAKLQPSPKASLAELRGQLLPEDLRGSFVLVLGLGSLRESRLRHWLAGPDHVLRILKVGDPEFQRLFRRARIDTQQAWEAGTDVEENSAHSPQEMPQ